MVLHLCMMSKERFMLNAMLFAAGLGTRLRPLTNDKPKALVELNGKPFLEHAIIKLKNIGVTRIVINVHHFANLVEDFIQQNDFGVEIRISDEREQLLDTGGGLKKVSDLFIPNAPILIYNVDIFSNIDLKQLLDTHKSTQALVTMAVRKRDCNRCLYFNDQRQLTGWGNNQTGERKQTRADMDVSTPIAFTGIHVVDYKLFSKITETGTFSIIDLYLRLAKTEKILAFEDHSDIWFDLGTPEQLALAELHFN